MVKRFFEKHLGSFEELDALKLIDKKVDRAKHLCCEKDPSYLKELALAYEMIEDYFQVKGVDPKAAHLR